MTNLELQTLLAELPPDLPIATFDDYDNAIEIDSAWRGSVLDEDTGERVLMVLIK